MDSLRAALRRAPDIDAVSPGGWTAAMCTASSGHAEILRELLRARCSLQPPEGSPQRPKVRPARGRGPLHLAAEMGHAEVCELLCHAGAGLEVRCHLGRSPFLAACAAGQPRSLEALVGLGANLLAEEDCGPGSGCRNAFHLLEACPTERHAACVRWLARLFLGPEDEEGPFRLVALLEGPAEVAASKPQTCTRRALARALQQARRLCRGGGQFADED